MNALLAPGTLVELPLAQIRPSATNPRKSIDEGKLLELMQSIATSGLHNPVLVRPIGFEGEVPEEHPVYELVAGSRRFKAFERLGGDKPIPAYVRTMTDSAAREASIIENLQRADVPPLEADFRIEIVSE